MNFGTAFVLAIVIAVSALALRSIFKKKGSCGCESGCESCGSAKSCCSQSVIDNLEVNLAGK